MRDKLLLSRSSLLVSLPVMGISLVCSALAAFFGQGRLAAILMFLFLMAGASRLWALASIRKVSVTLAGGTGGLFPGEEAEFQIRVENGKFLPVVWLELFFPLAPNLCLTPQGCREPDEWETPQLKEEGFCQTKVGEERFSFLLWYESRTFTSRWRANRRGIYSIAGWRLRTGDGFGLTQVERPISSGQARQLAVYPKLVKVVPDLFLRNLWNADTGTRGVMEDPTVIRSTRDYMTTDSLKHINWRLAARGLPLTVNIFEDILPKSVHFLVDGESFSGPDPHLEELEETLSILASQLMVLEERQVQCGLSLCRGRGGPAVNLFAPQGVEELLRALAAYQPMEPKWDEDGTKIVAQPPVFEENGIYEAAQGVGRFYYIAYDTNALSGIRLLRRLDKSVLSVLTYRDPRPFGEFEMVCLCHLKEEKGHG